MDNTRNDMDDQPLDLRMHSRNSVTECQLLLAENRQESAEKVKYNSCLGIVHPHDGLSKKVAQKGCIKFGCGPETSKENEFFKYVHQNSRRNIIYPVIEVTKLEEKTVVQEHLPKTSADIKRKVSEEPVANLRGGKKRQRVSVHYDKLKDKQRKISNLEFNLDASAMCTSSQLSSSVDVGCSVRNQDHGEHSNLRNENKVMNHGKNEFIRISKNNGLVQYNVGNPLDCDICGKKFNYPSYLKIHIMRHNGEKPFECTECEKAFTTEWYLNTHMRIHTGERPYRCATCQKKFTTLGTLKNHEMIHTGEKPYKCEICRKAFTRHGTLKVHLKIHMDKKPFICEICCKAFNQRSNLKTHKRIHTGEKPYSCEICGKAFKQINHLKIHKCRQNIKKTES